MATGPVSHTEGTLSCHCPDGHFEGPRMSGFVSVVLESKWSQFGSGCWIKTHEKLRRNRVTFLCSSY